MAGPGAQLFRYLASSQASDPKLFCGVPKLAAEQMAKTGGGSIVNISSIMSFVGGASGHPAYPFPPGQRARSTYITTATRWPMSYDLAACDRA
jgi:hypothetical protein